MDEIIIARLPPEHHHDWADTTISVAENALRAAGFGGVESLPDMVRFLTERFENSKAYGKTAIKVQMQMANFDFDGKFFSESVDADFSCYGKPHVWRYSRHPDTGEPIAQFKAMIQDNATFKQDEWGPWDEHYVKKTDSSGRLQKNVRVL